MYRFVVDDTITCNAYVGYRFESRNRWVRHTSVRVGVNNLFGEKPPLSSDSRGCDVSLYNTMARGLSWSVQLTKRL